MIASNFGGGAFHGIPLKSEYTDLCSFETGCFQMNIDLYTLIWGEGGVSSCAAQLSVYQLEVFH